MLGGERKKGRVGESERQKGKVGVEQGEPIDGDRPTVGERRRDKVGKCSRNSVCYYERGGGEKGKETRRCALRGRKGERERAIR